MDTASATDVPVKPANGLHDFARGPVLAIAAGTTLFLIAVSWRYGYHRDELYFLEASRHLAFGYVDQPPARFSWRGSTACCSATRSSAFA